MKAVEEKRLADYVEPAMSEARIERIWAGVEVGSAQASRGPARWRLGLAVVAAAAVAVMVLRPWASQETRAVVVSAEPPAARVSEAWLATGAQKRSYPLGKKSHVELGPETQVRVDRSRDEVRLRLERGSLKCSVAAGPERVVVHAGPAEIVTGQGGAELDVELEMRPGQGPMLRVGVDAGSAEVLQESSHERLAKLGAGQTWTNVKLAADGPEPAQPTAPRAAPIKTPLPPAPPASAATTSDAAELLAAAQRHRREGNAAAAAVEYDRLRKRHPGDARAGLAAFELARLRLDQLGDARGALEAFDAALGSGKGGFFVEDAKAGRVRALSKLGDSARCSRERDAFLKAHPKSPHAAQVRQLCKAR